MTRKVELPVTGSMHTASESVFEDDEYPFPKTPPKIDELTPPATKSASRKHFDGLIASSSSNPNIAPHPFLRNVGKLNGQIIIKGGFGGESEPTKFTFTKDMKNFPPLPNSAYELHFHDHHLYSDRASRPPSLALTGDGDVGGRTPNNAAPAVSNSATRGHSWNIRLRNLDGSTTDDVDEVLASKLDNALARRERDRKQRSSDESNKSDTLGQWQTKGEHLADTMNFKRLSCWSTDIPGVSGGLNTAEEQRVSPQT